MPRLKWFLVGVVVAVFSVEFGRTKLENRELHALLSKSIESSEIQDRNAKACISTLQDVREILEITTLRAQVSVLSRAQTLNLFDRAKAGDREAIQDLKDLGIDYPVSNKFNSQLVRYFSK